MVKLGRDSAWGRSVAFVMRSRLAIGLTALAAGMASSSSAQVTTTYTYDRQGQVTAVTRPGNATAYTYDAAGNRVAAGAVYPPPVTAGGSTLSVPFGGNNSLVLPVSGNFTSIVFDATPVKGNLALNGTTVGYYVIGANWGADSFAYHAVGPGGNSAIQTVAVTIGNPPAPVANNASLNVAYNAATALSLPITGVYTSVAVDSAPSKGSVSSSGTSATYTAAWPNYGSDSFTYHATGPGGASAVRTVSLTIANPPAPTAANGSANTVPNTPVTITYPVSGDYAVAALDSLPAHGSVSAPTYVAGVGAQSTYTPHPNYAGSDSWTFHATSPGGNSPARTFSINVINNPPVANADFYEVEKGTTDNYLDVLTNDSDPNGNPLTIISVTSTGSGASVSIAPTGDYLIFNAPTNVGYRNFEYTVSDGFGGFATGSVRVFSYRVF
jgi:YD repeat-containing protein